MAFSGQIPECDIDRTGSADFCAGTVKADIRGQQGSGNKFDISGILSDQPRADIVMDDGFDRSGTSPGFAQSGKVFISFNLNIR